MSSGARLGPYEILTPLGTGGMGEVWLAKDHRLQRKVAIKILPRALTEHPARVERFHREAHAASALNHPNVCTIYELGETSDCHQFIAMEFVEGRTVRERLAAGPLKTPDALDLTIQIASALTAAHAAGVVHRDIKPENVIVRPDGLVKVLDFGLAKLTGPAAAEGDTARTLLGTDAGTVMGTVAYMSPEQARGQDLDARTDVWSLGVVLYELLAGRLPFVGETPSDVLASILEHAPGPLGPVAPGVPAELQRILSKVLQKDRQRRYQGMRDLQLDLETLRDDLRLARQGSDVQAPATAIPARPGWRSAPTVGRLVAVVGLVAAAAVGGWWTRAAWTARRSPPAVTPGPVLTRLTFDAGLQTDVTWSPDGRSIAYASDKAGNFDIWVQSMDGGDARRITTSPAHDRQPSWSPDGSTIVLRSERDGGGLFVVPAGGGAERRLTSFGVQPRWSPDGSQILFTASDILAAGVASPLYTVRLDGKPPEQVLLPFLKQFRSGLGGMLDWNWYPDSRHVSVLGVVEGQGFGVFTAPLSGGPPKLLKQTPGLGRWSSFAWASPSMLLVDCDNDGVHSLARLTVDPETMTVRATARITIGDGWQPRFAIASNGRRIAFTMTRMSQRLWVLPLDPATGQPTGNGEPVTDSMARATTSGLARDGGKLAYELARPGSARTELWTTDTATGDSRALAGDDQQRQFPQWSPDDTRLAYRWARRTREGQTEMGLAVRSMDTNDEELVTTPRTDAFITTWDWAPDGRSILASSGPVPFVGRAFIGLWPLSAAPHAETAVHVLAADEHYAIWQARYSPDGRWICFSAIDARTPGTSAIFVIPSAGADRSQWRPLTRLDGWADKPRWSRDGKLVYFARADSFMNVWAVRFDGARGAVGEPFPITRYDSPRHQLTPRFGDAEIGVSARRLLLTIMEQTGNLWLLDDESMDGR